MLEKLPIAVLKRPWLVVIAVIAIIAIGIRQ